MLQVIQSILDAVHRSRDRRRIAKQFVAQGFKEVDCPHILEMLPLRFPEIVQNDSVCMFAKQDARVLLVPTAFTPRSRLAHRPHLFVLSCMNVGNRLDLQSISAGLRSASEQTSIVDQLALDSYPSISPLPDYTLFAADQTSAARLLEVMDILGAQTPTGSLVIHAGRAFIQVS